jgi:uncharacterized UBP type Zn finger protein
MLPYEKHSDGSIFDIGIAFKNILIPKIEIIETRRGEKLSITYPQQDVEEAVSATLIPFLEELQKRGILSGLIDLFNHEEIEYFCTSCDQNHGKVYSREVRKPSFFLHLKFNDAEMNKVLSVSDLLQLYCAEETVEYEEDVNFFHSLYQHNGLSCDFKTKKRINMNFANSELILVHISFLIGAELLTTNKISIMASLFIEDSFQKKYALVGFVVHKGGIHSGHCIAYVVDADHTFLQWVRFDDLEGVTVVIKPASFFENITSDTSSHVCLLIYGKNSNKISNFHFELKTEGNFDHVPNSHIFLNYQLNIDM